MEETSHFDSCNSRVHAYKNGKTMEQCKEEATENTRVQSKEVLENGGEVSWTQVLDMSGHDELIYKSYFSFIAN